MVHERSVGNLAMAIVAIVLLAVSLALPWFSYEHSSGRRTAPNDYLPEGDDGVIRESWTAGPGTAQGDPADEPAKADRAADWLAWSLYAAIALLVLVVVSELPRADRVLTRRVSLGLGVLAFAAIGAAVAIGWFVLPDSYGHEVDQPFESHKDGDGYTMTTLRAGWVLGAVALAPVFAGFLLKFQAGAPDPTVVAQLYAQGEL